MVVCGGFEPAIPYVHAIRAYLLERKSPCRAIVAFSGEPEYQGGPVTESKLTEPVLKLTGGETEPAFLRHVGRAVVAR